MVGRSAAVAMCVAASMASESISLNMVAIGQALIACERATVVSGDVDATRGQLEGDVNERRGRYGVLCCTVPDSREN